MRDYQAWHREYDDPNSALAQRLRVVQQRLSDCLTAAPPGPIRVISLCAGEGRDLIGVLPGHPRRADATALLVELDPQNVAAARETAGAAGLTNVDVVRGDAAVSDIYASAIPADVVLACGIFGNVSDRDVENTVRNLSMLCRTGSSVIWTRHRNPPDLTRRIRDWFQQSGFAEVSFDALGNATLSCVGADRLIGVPIPFEAGFRFFTFAR